MTKDDIIRMAREAGLCDEEGRDDSSVIIENHLKRFAELVIKPWADQLEVERKKFQELNDVAALGMQHARADEREACAKVCEEVERKATHQPPMVGQGCQACAVAIRARGSKPTAVIYSPGQLAERGLTHEDVVKLIKENT